MDSVYYEFILNMLQKLKEQQVVCPGDDFICSLIPEFEDVLNNENVDSNFTVLNIQEQDRQRIARDLHDSSLQNLTHLIHKIELCKLYIDQDPVRAKMEMSVLCMDIRSVISEIRNTIFDLRPMQFDDLGLKAAIERLVEVINKDKTYQIFLSIDDVLCETEMILVNIYHVIKEALINIVKHSDADIISLQCNLKDNLYVVDITDNGIGFDLSSVCNDNGRHFGMSLMKERVSLLGGSIDILSKINNGTCIHIEIPLYK